MEIIVQFFGLGIFIIGGILFLIEAFKTSLLWGLGCVFLTPVVIIPFLTPVKNGMITTVL